MWTMKRVALIALLFAGSVTFAEDNTQEAEALLQRARSVMANAANSCNSNVADR